MHLLVNASAIALGVYCYVLPIERSPMETRITRDVLESYVFCKYKSYLKLVGQQGHKSDYESLLTTMRSEIRLNALAKIRVRNQENQVVSNTVLTASILEQ